MYVKYVRICKHVGMPESSSNSLLECREVLLALVSTSRILSKVLVPSAIFGIYPFQALCHVGICPTVKNLEKDSYSTCNTCFTLHHPEINSVCEDSLNESPFMANGQHE